MAKQLAPAGLLLLACAAAGLVGAVHAQPLAGLAAPGYTGAGMTPSAEPAAWGQVLLGHDQALPGHSAAPRGHNFLVSAGVLPGLELTARLATNDLHCNIYLQGSDPCRGAVTRDLSASFKAGHRFGLAALPGVRLSAAIGATDLGGAATSNRAWYGVLGAERGAWAATAGLARAHSPQAALDGAFGSLRWRAHEAVQLQAEAIGRRQWLGARLTLPARWRPDHLEPWLQWQHSMQRDSFTPAQWWSAGVSVQLDAPQRQGPAAWAELVSDLVASRRVAAAEPARQVARQRAPALVGEAAAMASRWAAGLGQRLARAGFDDIAIGRRDDGVLVVDVENGAWRWNDLDALGVALRRVASAAAAAPAPAQRLDMRLRRQGVVVWRADMPLACLDSWLAGQACAQVAEGSQAAPRLWAGAKARPAADEGAIAWWQQRGSPSWQHPRLEFAPDLDTRVGTEFGAFDSTWGVDIALQWPLWRGATADLAWVRAIDHSADYAPGQVFTDFRIDDMWFRAMLHQVADLGPGLTGRASVGRLFGKLDGGQVELRWAPGDGQHRFGIASALFNHTDIDFQKRSTIASYRYMVQPLQTALELHGGRFWHGDRGLLAVSRHWFGDVAVALYLRRSQFRPDAPRLYSPYGSQWVNAAGIEFSFPLTTRRDVEAVGVRVRGAERFGYGVQSVVGSREGSNNLSPWFGRFAPVPMALDASVHNMDRNSQGWLDRQHGRIREAARLEEAPDRP